MQQRLWDPIGWKKPIKKPIKADGAAPALAIDAAALKAQLGSVVGLHSDEEWEAAMQVSCELPVVVDFTATWCAQASAQPGPSLPLC